MALVLARRGNLVRPAHERRSLDPGGLRHFLLSKGVMAVRTGGALTLQVRDGIHWALSGSVHHPKYEEGQGKPCLSSARTNAHNAEYLPVRQRRDGRVQRRYGVARRRSGSPRTRGRPRRSGNFRRARGPVWRVVPGRLQGSNAGARSTRRSFTSLLDPVTDLRTRGAWPWATSGFCHPEGLDTCR